MRGLRNLEFLYRTASTSRVLNLNQVYQESREEKDYDRLPFFSDPLLNRAIYIKHRLRADEAYLMPHTNLVATKIIFPFDSNTLKAGGQSIFIGQTGYQHTLWDMVGGESAHGEDDMMRLSIIDQLPSLDPFLLKETMSRHGFEVADCYFAMSPADIERIRTFAGEQIRQLISLALSGSDAEMSTSIKRMVDAILTKDNEGRLDPLRVTLGLDGHQFEESIFSWKGFLYYKWQFSSNMSKLNKMASAIDRVTMDGVLDRQLAAAIKTQKIELKKAISKAARSCVAILTLYDDAFKDLVEHGNAAAFRKFLLEAPLLFVKLGYSMGVMSHITSFWDFRFPNPTRLYMQASEYLDLLTEFLVSLTETNSDELMQRLPSPHTQFNG
ncbi:hypothetical protein [Candidatus Phycosocius spiralis]|uniref:Uncharacterized protein n=1 Tax=Candidatus Phycosocius spiralis TaxID=2815099 RepID=A0ABQ4PV34_9PROT|nr:hypothetical protein [Candidatus Phycosocius spiralis]GIU66838.1 hypothetical protein PsB1_0992 [Candidatus Phycosocius spiralis]